MIWSKQFYRYDVAALARRRPGRARPRRRTPRPQRTWRHFDAYDVISMPDPWEYPWFAAWDLAFHSSSSPTSTPTSPSTSSPDAAASGTCTPTARCRPTSGTSTTSTRRCTPGRRCGSSRSTAAPTSRSSTAVFHKLLLNFTWWVNRVDEEGNNVFEGGFLGLDNIGPIDRSHAAAGLPPRAGRRHGVDGVLLPDHAADRPAAGRARRVLRRDWR